MEHFLQAYECLGTVGCVEAELVDDAGLSNGPGLFPFGKGFRSIADVVGENSYC